MTGWFLLVAALLLMANAFFVAVEFALLASRATRLQPMAERGDDERAVVALEAVRDLQPQLAGAQLGITMASLGLGHVAEPAVANILEPLIDRVVDLPSGVLHTISLVAALSIVVPAHMVLGEMVPKNIAIAEPERAARLLAPIHRAYVSLLHPVVWSLTRVSNAIVGLFGCEPADEINTVLTVNEFRILFRGAAQQGKLEDVEHVLLAGALDFRARTVGSIMVPRTEIVSCPRSTSVADLERLVADSGHSRIPITGAGLDDVIGFVHSKDLLKFGPDERQDQVPLEMIRRMLIVAPDRSVRDLMFAMRRLRRHLALVRTDEGRLLGMVTLEDVLEALVGDITDETDVGPPTSARPTGGQAPTAW